MKVRKSKFIYESITNYSIEMNDLEILLEAVLKNPIFDKYKECENEVEVELLSEGIVMGGARVPPHPDSFSGKSSRVLGALAAALKDTDMDSFEGLNKLSMDLNKIMSKIDPVIEYLDSEDYSTQVQANILIAKVFIYLKNMLNLVVEANENLQGLLPTGFDIDKARNLMAASAKIARLADDEEVAKLQAKIEKGKEGLGSRFLKFLGLKESI